ncbi:DUF1405 domain-containing protein [Bacillus sp. JJ864]|uniref:DUF1405 domain-containing protein n=1 Tax=Bacillus sp. JJ864 TaxID=3122975 RepID=UPI0030007B25
MAYTYLLLRQRSFLWLLLIINIFGTVYGYIWYKNQLIETPAIFWPFVPDSPTASLFFVFVLIAFVQKKNWGLMEALAVITLVKYGIWAVVVNVLTLIVTGYIGIEGYILIIFHMAMAVQGLLYAPFYRMKYWHFIIAVIWTLHNDVIDYVWGQMPKYSVMYMYDRQIGYFTFWLSIIVLATTYYFCLREKRLTLSL